MHTVKMETRTVNLGILVTSGFNMALSHLMNNSLPIWVSYALVKISTSVAEHQNTHEQVRKQLLNKYGQLDADGVLMTDADKTSYLIKDKAGFDADYAELDAITVEIPMVPLSSLDGIKLSPAMLSVLTQTAVNSDL